MKEKENKVILKLDTIGDFKWHIYEDGTKLRFFENGMPFGKRTKLDLSELLIVIKELKRRG